MLSVAVDDAVLRYVLSPHPHLLFKLTPSVRSSHENTPLSRGPRRYVLSSVGIFVVTLTSVFILVGSKVYFMFFAGRASATVHAAHARP